MSDSTSVIPELDLKLPGASAPLATVISTTQPTPTMEEQIETARLAAIQEDNPVLSRLFPYQAHAMAKGSEGTLSKAGLAAIGDVYSLPGRVAAAKIDEAINNSDFGESLSQTTSDSKYYIDENGNVQERNLGGSILQGALRDPTLLLSGLTGVAGKATLAGLGRALPRVATAIKSAPTVEKIVQGSGGGATVGTLSGMARPFLEDTELSAGNVGLETLAGGGLGALGGLASRGLEFMGLKSMSPAHYRRLLLDLAHKNNLHPNVMEAASNPSELALMAANFRTRPKIADDILEYKNFNENNFPEHKTVQEFLERSQSKVTPEDAVGHLTGYGDNVRQKAGGGGLNTDETSSAARLQKESAMFFDNSSPSQVREMTAAQVNNVRQRIGDLLSDDFKREALGRPNGEIQALKNAYGAMRAHLIKIAENEGETAAIEAYKTMANKLGVREAMFEALRVLENKYTAADRLTKNLRNIADNDNKTQLRTAIKNFDDAFGTNFNERIKYANYADAVGDRLGLPETAQFALKNDNNFFTGKGLRRLTDGLTGRTISSAVRKLEGAKPRSLRELTGNPELAVIVATEGGFAPRIIETPKRHWNSVADMH